jgi:hypothetical protein
VSYENITKKFQFRGLDDPNIYYTGDYRSFVQNHRSSLNTIAEAFIAAGDKAKARDILLLSLTKMPDKGVRYDFTNAHMVDLLFEVGEKEKAMEITKVLTERSDETAAYYISKREYGRDLQIPIVILSELQRILYKYGETETAKKIEETYEKHFNAFQSRSNGRSDF